MGITLSQASWKNYIELQRKTNERAVDLAVAYLKNHPTATLEEVDAFITYAYAIATKYGEASAELACEMYDAMAAASGVTLPAAEPAATATYGEIARTVQGEMLRTENPNAIGAAVGRLVKAAGEDTTLKNAIRDGAQFAWVPSGDTCAFCMTLASNGWRYASKDALEGGHAEHIHNNCDCSYAIRFDSRTKIKGYDPDYYRAMYDNAEGSTSREKINSMRRAQYAANPEKYREQNRTNYIASKVRKLFDTLPTDSVVEKLRTEYQPWVQSLSSKEFHALRKYTKNEKGDIGEAFYLRLNKMLRGDGPSDPMLQAYAETISDTLKRASLKSKVAAYRGLDVDIYKNLKRGDRFPGKQFTSASVIPSKAFQGDYNVVIIAPQGSKCAYLDQISAFPNQRELLFDKDCDFRVLYNYNKLTILEVIV